MSVQARIDAGLIELKETRERSRIILKDKCLFVPGGVQVGETYLPVLDKIAEALADVPGAIVVSGHTDNVPLRTLRFPSNYHFSQARAKAVMRILADRGGNPKRFTAVGRADGEPLAPNQTAEGRALNRRVEIEFTPTLRSGAERPRQ